MLLYLAQFVVSVVVFGTHFVISLASLWVYTDTWFVALVFLFFRCPSGRALACGLLARGHGNVELFLAPGILHGRVAPSCRKPTGRPLLFPLVEVPPHILHRHGRRPSAREEPQPLTRPGNGV